MKRKIWRMSFEIFKDLRICRVHSLRGSCSLAVLVIEGLGLRSNERFSSWLLQRLR